VPDTASHRAASRRALQKHRRIWITTPSRSTSISSRSSIVTGRVILLSDGRPVCESFTSADYVRSTRRRNVGGVHRPLSLYVHLRSANRSATTARATRSSRRIARSRAGIS
jgi:hypothetical protein